MLSSDSDFTQLVTGPEKSRVTLISPMKGVGEVPWPGYDYVVWKALRGDPTDNIPGLPGIGDKRAATLVGDRTRLAALLQDPVLREQYERNLVLIQLRDVEAGGVPMQVTHGDGDWDRVKAALEEMQMTSMLADKYWQKFMATFTCLRVPPGAVIMAE